jgi:hypothetical protein
MINDENLLLIMKDNGEGFDLKRIEINKNLFYPQFEHQVLGYFASAFCVFFNSLHDIGSVKCSMYLIGYYTLRTNVQRYLFILAPYLSPNGSTVKPTFL